ncbi:MAG TPA: serine/threonine-protein kinase, partial [Kofleriaceae bacterium]|nr:serine/threonine-protein kinase [Kofleriaceae bacterium]
MSSEPIGSGRVGQIVGNYRLLRVLGEGGVGTVYEGEHTRLGRKVAVKLLHDSVATAETVTRFFNEARAVNEIRHPNIIEVEDFVSTPGGEHYMLMELLVGQDLRTAIFGKGVLAPDRVAAIGLQVASALAAVHRVGIIHRDLKPDNIFLVDDVHGERAKLLDFGVAKFTNDQHGVTRAGMTMGTPQYMAPEQIIAGRENDVGSGVDIYALGMVLYEALSGLPAFHDMPTAQILRAQCFEPIELPSRRRGEPLPPVLEAAVMKCLEKDRANRFATADELVDALRGQAPVRFSGQRAISAPPYVSVRRSRSRIAMMVPAFAMAGAAIVIQVWPKREARATVAAVERAPVAPDVAPTPPAAAEVTVQLASRPPGAHVFRDGVALGQTPLVARLATSSELVTFVARFADGSEVTQTVVPDRAVPELVFVQRRAALRSAPSGTAPAPDVKKPTKSVSKPA